MKITQDGLKAMGFEVRVMHSRYAHPPYNQTAEFEQAIRKACLPFLPRGGRTDVIIARDSKEIGGTAFCSTLDNFNRKIGFQIAAGRALKAWKELYG